MQLQKGCEFTFKMFKISFYPVTHPFFIFCFHLFEHILINVDILLFFFLKKDQGGYNISYLTPDTLLIVNSVRLGKNLHLITFKPRLIPVTSLSEKSITHQTDIRPLEAYQIYYLLLDV